MNIQIKQNHSESKKGHWLSLYAYFFFIFLVAPSGAFAKILVISDIDDTLKVTHVLSKAGAVSSALDSSSRFVGMSEIFQALKTNQEDIEFHYVSLASKVLMGYRHRDFIRVNHFPLTQLHLNSSLKQDPQFKQKVIRNLLKAKNPEVVLFFGDNGQFDTLAYAQIVKEFPQIAFTTYIREAYSRLKDSKYPTEKNQIGFVTSVEVAHDLSRRTFLPENITNEIESIVYQKLRREGDRKAFGAMVFPWWQDCRDFVWRWNIENPTYELAFVKSTITRKCHQNFDIIDN